MIISYFLALAVLYISYTSDAAITKNQVDWFLETLGRQVENKLPPHPLQLVEEISASLGIHHHSIYEIVDIVCMISQDNDHHPGITGHNVKLIKTGCDFMESISSRFLQYVGRKLNTSGEQNLPSLISISVEIQKKNLYFKHAQSMIPFVCEKVRAGISIRRISMRQPRNENIKIACDFLERISVQFLITFARDGHTESDPARLNGMLGITGGFLTNRNRHVTYREVSPMLPHICQGKLSTNYLRNDVQLACTFFNWKTSQVMTSISQVLGKGDLADRAAVTRWHSQQGWAFCFHQAKPFMHNACAQDGFNFDLHDSNLWATPACNYFLVDHMEELLKPQRE